MEGGVQTFAVTTTDVSNPHAFDTKHLNLELTVSGFEVNEAPCAALFQVPPPSVLCCHWNVRVPEPVACTVYATVFPDVTFWVSGVGSVVTDGTGQAATVSVAGFEVVLFPHVVLLTLHRNLALLSPVTTLKLYVAVAPPVPPVTLFHVPPPSLLRSHW
jgi:hypothetical protein